MTTTFVVGDKVRHTNGKEGFITRGTDPRPGGSHTVSVQYPGRWRPSVIAPRYLTKVEDQA